MSQEYRVGSIYHPGKTRWTDGTDFNYRSNTLELRMFFSRLTHSDIRAIRNGPCTFHFTIVEDTLFFLFEFGKACPLSDNSYSWWLVSEQERTIPPVLKSDERALLTIILVSSEDGIIRALRQISLSHEFSIKLFDAIREQTTRPFDRVQHDLKIARVYSKYPTSKALRSVSIATCVIPGSEKLN